MRIEENPEESLRDWLHCPECGSEEVSLHHFSPWTDERPIVRCTDCKYARYFD